MAGFPPKANKTQNEYNQWRIDRGLYPYPQKKARYSHYVKVSDEAWEGLAFLAEKFGYLEARGYVRKKPLPENASISILLESIGQGLLDIQPRDSYNL